jgi:hypothetical protein
MALEVQYMIKQIAAKVNTNLIARSDFIALGITEVFFSWGSLSELVDRIGILTDLQVSANKKFPLIHLFTDIPKTKSVDGSYLWDCELHLIIANITEKKYDSEQRQANNFRPILYPVLFEFEQQIKNSSYFVSAYNLDWQTTDRYKWGRDGIIGVDGNNLFEDYIDCIEIQNFNLKVKKTEC